MSKTRKGSAIAVLIVLGLSSITSAVQAAPKKLTIGVSVADQKSLFYVAAVEGMRVQAKASGVKLIVLSADNNASQQLAQVKSLITQHVDALVFIAQDATAAAAGVKAANAAKIPVIAVDEKPESGQGKLATYIATDSVKAADVLCTWLFKQIGNSGEIGILHGVVGGTAEKQRTEGCHLALARTPGIKVVAEAIANWDETQAYKATTDMLTAHPAIKAIFGESDAMGLGAAKAAKAAGVKIVAVGIDGFPTMVTAIQQGLTQATQAQIPYKMGIKSILNSIAFATGKGKTVPAVQLQNTVLVTADNANSVDVTQFYGSTK